MNDDHKTINERLLEVAIPEDTCDNSTVTLECCLESYFNNKIEVKRHMQRRSMTRKQSAEGKSETILVETNEISPSTPSSPVAKSETKHPMLARPLSIQTRTSSIFSERCTEANGSTISNTGEGGVTSGRPRKGSLRKEVSMPAWQFFRLIRKHVFS